MAVTVSGAEVAVPRAGVSGAGLVCLVAALLGAGSGVALAVVDPVVDPSRWSYPQSTRAYVLTQVWFAVQHLGLLAGLVGLGRSGAAGAHRRARVSCRAAVVGMAALALTEVVASLPAAEPASATLPLVLGAVYGVVSTVLGVALVVLGADVVRARRWDGWRRWVPLAAGVWVFVPMFPAMASGFLGARLSISGWMLLFAALGLALLRPTTAGRE